MMTELLFLRLTFAWNYPALMASQKSTVVGYNYHGVLETKEKIK